VEADDTGCEAGDGGLGAEDEGLRPLDGLSTSGGIQNKLLKPLLSSSSIFSGLDFRSSNPSISRRVGKLSRLDSKGALLSGLLSGFLNIVGGLSRVHLSSSLVTVCRIYRGFREASLKSDL
jgi:hypothetical protein